MFNTLSWLALRYITQLLSPYEPVIAAGGHRGGHSSAVPKSNLKNGDLAFSVKAAEPWKDLLETFSSDFICLTLPTVQKSSTSMVIYICHYQVKHRFKKSSERCDVSRFLFCRSLLQLSKYETSM